MRRRGVNALALIAVLISAGLILGQEPALPSPKGGAVPKEKKPTAQKPDKSKLEEMLAQALKHNPDLRVAAANVTLAEAELSRTRLQVTREIVALYYAIDTQKTTVAHQEGKLHLLQAKFKNGVLTFDKILDTQQAVTLAKAKLAELEAQIPALLGKAARSGEANNATVQSYLSEIQGLHARAQDQRKAQGPTADKIRKALATPIAVDYKDVSFSDVVKDLQKKARLSFQKPPNMVYVGKVTLQIEEVMPISAVLQALADQLDYAFIVRAYGILVTTPEAAPPGAITVQEFMRQKPAEK